MPVLLRILSEMQAVFAARGDSYADIEDNSREFTRTMIAQGIRIPDDMTAAQFYCMSNISTKLARFATGDRRHEDTLIDIAGYALLMAACHRRDHSMATPQMAMPMEEADKKEMPHPLRDIVCNGNIYRAVKDGEPFSTTLDGQKYAYLRPVDDRVSQKTFLFPEQEPR